MHASKWLLSIAGLFILNGCTGAISAPTPAHIPTRLVATQTTHTSTEPTVQIYRATADCSTLVPESQAVTDVTLEQAVGAAIATFQTADFPIAGYRVRQDSPQTVTIDLRLPPEAQRPFQSLSPCEQLALFGSLRQTVQQFDPDVQTIEFTHQGQAIAF